MQYPGTLILTQKDIAGLMKMGDYMNAVENAFLLLSNGRIPGAGILDIPAIDGMFHAKGASMHDNNELFVAVKVNGNFPDNKARFGLPTIQGAILLCDGIRGYPLALLDSIEITIQRTAAATAIAARHLARDDSKTVTICGCGTQAPVQLLALLQVLPISRAFAFDQDQELCERFSKQMQEQFNIPVNPLQRLADGTRKSDIIVTSTTSRRYVLSKQDVPPGTFVAAVGTDSHDKQEIDPALLASSKVVTDILDQCARIGDLHHAIAGEWMAIQDVYAELHEIISGSKPGRTSEEEITIFDSTGSAIQDVASAAIVYRRAVEAGVGSVAKLF